MNSHFDDSHLAARWIQVLRYFGKRMWVRASLFSAAAIFVAVIAALLDPYLPTLPVEVALVSGSVSNILNILASSLLAVTSFSLSIMVNAYSAASSSVTPRATKLLLLDTTATTTMSTFIGGFLFSIVGIIGLSAQIYTEQGRNLLFAATIVVLLMVTASLLRWIEQLGYFGRVGDTMDRVERAAMKNARHWGSLPRLGARPEEPIPEQAVALRRDRTGYVQYIDMANLQQLAEKAEAEVYIRELPGSFVHPNTPLAYVLPALEAKQRSALERCFTVERDRNFDQDPRFGLVVLAEISSRALSPAINDPGTAIAVLGGAVRVFQSYVQGRLNPRSLTFDRLHAPEIELSSMMEDLFNPAARDGAAMVEVQVILQKSLRAIAELSPDSLGPLAREQSRRATEHSARHPYTAHERARLREAASWSLGAPALRVL